jgi:hypothetical protein
MLIYVPGGVTKWYKCFGPASPFPLAALHQCLLLLHPTAALAPSTAPRLSPAPAAALVPAPHAKPGSPCTTGQPGKPPLGTNRASQGVSVAYPSHPVQMPSSVPGVNISGSNEKWGQEQIHDSLVVHIRSTAWTLVKRWHIFAMQMLLILIFTADCMHQHELYR